MPSSNRRRRLFRIARQIRKQLLWIKFRLFLSTAALSFLCYSVSGLSDRIRTLEQRNQPACYKHYAYKVLHPIKGNAKRSDELCEPLAVIQDRIANSKDAAKSGKNLQPVE